uniref:Uncharacterized protein n=1 Tax=Arundo donax TaxID=35708 RepID=A0A0A9HVY1_ARUDO
MALYTFGLIFFLTSPLICLVPFDSSHLCCLKLIHSAFLSFGN